jgi:hypothetical protein
LGLTFARQIAEQKLAISFIVAGCDHCNSRSLLVDLRETPSSHRYIIRIARKFARQNGLVFSIDCARCASCGEIRGAAVEHLMEFGKNGLEKNEIKFRGDTR